MSSLDDYQAFREWVEATSKKNLGTRIEKCGHKDVPYVPPEDLKQHWEPNRVWCFLPSPHNGGSVGVNDLIQDYLRIFATLVYISTPEHTVVKYLYEFSSHSRDDRHLPFSREDLDKIFTSPQDGESNREMFYRYQFLFNPQQLAEGNSLKLHNRHLAVEDILPISFARNLNTKRDVAAAEVKLFTLSPSSGLQTATNNLVAKIFPPSELEFTFRWELQAYSVINSLNYEQDGCEYFLKYYGSFVQNGSGVILLEFADRGSLLEFFAKESPPYERQELFELWTNLANLLRGLTVLHNLDKWQTRDALRGIHQDLKPSNIFVFADGNPSNNKYRFKIGDFGLSSFDIWRGRSDGRMPDHNSTKVYGAPELVKWDSKLSHLDSGVTFEVDMWSIGCVLIEAAVWAVCGERGRQEFLEDRRLETATMAAACINSFHNGHERLQAVQDMVKKLLNRRREHDNLTERLYKWLCDTLLVPRQHGRLSANQAFHQMQRHIEDAKPGLRLAIPPSTDLSLSTSSARSPVTNPGFMITPHLNQQSKEADFSHRPGILGQGSSSFVEPISPMSLHVQDSSQPKSTEGTPRSILLDASRGHYEPSDIRIQPGEQDGHRKPDSSFPQPERQDARSLEYHRASKNQPALLDHEARSASAGFVPLLQHIENDGLHVRPLPAVRRDPLPAPLSPSSVVHRASGTNTVQQTQTLQSSSRQSPEPSKHSNSITIRQVLEWRHAKRTGGSAELPRELNDIPDMLRGRDQVFLVDNSQSMLGSWVDAKQAVEAIGCVVKDVDPDGMELRFTSKPTVSHRCKTTKDLLEKFSSHTPRDGNKCVMENALNLLVNGLVLSPPNPKPKSFMGLRRGFVNKAPNVCKTGISVYVLTNGVWSGSTIHGRAGKNDSDENYVYTCGVDNTIRTLIDRLRAEGQSRPFMTLQFIRFGHDKIGKQRLIYLDNEVARGWDIVDHRYHGGSLRPILIGALDEHDYPSDDSEGDEPT